MNLKRCLRTFSVFSTSLIMLFQVTSLGFNSRTHESVTKKSLNNMEDIGCALNEHNELSERNNEVLKDLKDYKEYIINFSLQPDTDDNQGGTYKCHFHNPITKKNFLGERKTALTKCVKHYENALADYAQGNKDKAYENLGRAIHFLEDLSTCVHTGYDNPSDAIVKLQLHVHFEKICDKVSGNCNAEIPIESLEYYTSNRPEVIAHSTAVLSNDNFYRLENLCSEVQLNAEKDLAKNSVLNAQKRVTGLVYKFLREA